MDFAEYRAYMPGDDIRQVDWKVYSRTDRYFVKQFEGDTNTNVNIAFDASASMNFASGEITKLDYGRYLAASLAYFASRQRDRIGLVTFDHQVRDWVPPAAKHLQNVLLTLDRLEAGGESDLVAPLMRLTQAIRRRAIVVVISDLYEEPERVVEALRGFKARGCDVVVFHILDPAELDFPYTGPGDFVDLESGERLPVVPESLGDRYRELIQGHIADIQRRLTELDIDYQQIGTRTPLDAALHSYLGHRLARMKS